MRSEDEESLRVRVKAANVLRQHEGQGVLSLAAAAQASSAARQELAASAERFGGDKLFDLAEAGLKPRGCCPNCGRGS